MIFIVFLYGQTQIILFIKTKNQMKLQIRAEIEGSFILKERIDTKLYPYDFSIYSKDGKRYISITKPIKDYSGYEPKLYVKNGLLNIEATKNGIYKDMEEWLYYIEAMGAFNFEISKIHIDELEVSWIYENDDEKGQIPIVSLKRNMEDKKATKCVTNNSLSNIVLHRRLLPDAHIPFSYYRQAKVFFDVRNYYFAFINYFMMLEYCFADGKFQKREVINNFKKSNLLKLCVLSAVSMIKKNDTGGNYEWLLSECKTRGKKIDFEGILYLIVEYRGLLSHASNRSKQYLFDNQKLRPISLIISMICFMLCGYIQVYSGSNEDSKNKMILEQIEKINKNFE